VGIAAKRDMVDYLDKHTYICKDGNLYGYVIKNTNVQQDIDFDDKK
jgi:hypothetical protein